MIDTPDTQQLSEWGRAIVARRWAKRYSSTCALCGQGFEGKDGQIYCSKRCYSRAAYLRRRHLAGSHPANCAYCGKPFQAVGRQIYDTKECGRLGQALKAKTERAARKAAAA